MPPSRKDRQRRRETLRPHPMRDQILDVMRAYDKPISPTQLSRIIGGTLGSTAYHVRTLVSAGVVELAEEGRVRGAVEHFYALVPGDKDESRLTDPVAALLGICGALTVPGEDGGYPLPVVIDDSARDQIRALIDRISPEVKRIASEATSRA